MFKDLEIKIRELKNEIDILRSEYNKTLKEKQTKLDNLQTKLNLAYAGVNVDYLDIAKKILYVEGLKYCKTGESPHAVSKAINDVMDGFKLLRREYFGAKNYAQWECQSITCRYGYGPTHGSVVFRIGMTDIARKRKDFTDEEIDACLYYLRHLDQIKNLVAK